jgi:hypothetical protein
VRVREDGALRDGVTVATAKTESEPVANGVSDSVPVGTDDEPVLVIADNLFELALGLRLGSPSCALEDSLSTGGGACLESVPERAAAAILLAELRSGDSLLSVRVRPSSLKRDWDCSTTSTGESAW